MEKHRGESCKGALAVQVTDSDGEGRACIKHFKEQGQTCDDDNCYRLSRRLKWNLSNTGDVDIKLFTERTSKDKPDERYSCANFGEEPITHKTLRKLAEEAAEKKKAEQEEQAAKLKKDITSCKDADLIENLLKKSQELKDVGAITDEIHKDNEEKLEKVAKAGKAKKLLEIAAKISRAKTEDLSSIREDLLSHANENPEHVDNVAEYLRQVAQRYQATNSGAEGFDLAKESLEEALNLSDVKESTKALLEKDQRDVEFMVDNAPLIEQAKKGMMNNPRFQFDYQKRVMAIRQDMIKQCYGSVGYSRGETQSQEGCAEAIKNQEKFEELQLPARAQLADQAKLQERMSLMQTMYHPGATNLGSGLGALGSGMGNSFWANPYAIR